MTNLKEINSTERLLKVIRNSGPAPQGMSQPGSKSEAAGRTGFARRIVDDVRDLSSRFALRSASAVGVEVEDGELRMVKMAAKAGTRQVAAVCRVELPSDMTPESQRYPAFLREQLCRHCGSARGLAVWTTIPSDKVDVWNLKVPALSGAELANAVYWTAKKERSFAEEQSIFDFEVQGEAGEPGKLLVTAYSAPKATVERLRETFAKAGYPLAGIAIPAFALQNYIRSGCLDDQAECTAIVDINTRFTRIDIVRQGRLLLSRVITAGLGSIMEEIAQGYAEQTRANDSHFKASPLNMQQAEQIFFRGLGIVQEPKPEAVGSELTSQEALELAAPAVQRLARQVERTFDHSLRIMGNPQATRLLVKGTAGLHQGVMDILSGHLGLSPEILDPFASRCRLMPTAASRRATDKPALAMAWGLALAGDRWTPNLLNTFAGRESARRRKRMESLATAACVLGMLVAGGFYTLERMERFGLAQEVRALETRFAAAEQGLSRNEMLSLAGEISRQRNEHRDVQRKLLPAAAVGELIASVPPGVALLGLRLEPGRDTEGKPLEGVVAVTLEGLAQGDPAARESALAVYLLNLQGSSLLRETTLRRRDAGSMEDAALRFTIATAL
ncbi:MAG: pilus assembly protein PilM [Desulfocurvibacter africanus]